MDETPNDSGESPVDPLNDTILLEPVAALEPDIDPEPNPAPPAGSRWGETGIGRMSGDELQAQLRRPAVWGLVLLITIVLAVQIWLLFL